MSRSYKKHPNCRMSLWGKSMKAGKKFSNRKIRRKLKNNNTDIKNGKDYIQYGSDNWDLHEYNCLETKQEVIKKWEYSQKAIANGAKSCEFYKNYSLEEAIKDWKTSYFQK